MRAAVKNIQPFKQGTTRAIFDLQYGSLMIKGLSLHEKDGSRWVTMPSKKKVDKNHKPYFEDVIQIPDKAKLRAFENWCLKELDGKMWKPSVQATFPKGQKNQADPTYDLVATSRYKRHKMPKGSSGGIRISPESDRITGLSVEKQIPSISSSLGA